MRNRYEIQGDVVVITLTRRGGKEPLETTVSRRHLAKLLALDVRWYAKPHETLKYIVVAEFRNGDRKQVVQLNRFLLDFPEDRFVIHEDGNTLNNTDENLHVQPFNTEVFAHISRLPVGVHYLPKTDKWLVVGYVNRTKREVGKYPTKGEAETVLNQLNEYWKKYSFPSRHYI